MLYIVLKILYIFASSFSILTNKNGLKMKKVISVHLDGKMFQMEEEAYTYLNNVLSRQWKKQ